ncbi:hypothetical protein [Bdellovibrio svalbardensis]|uniref:Porin family protein n=1 Tax=Bdellovibrio svalbardensis TaxID=2972972 RepID=A0ABT6DMB2_9BACT|nr:hypothetical protein [Bdellovibrio svalbardensis]MDG0817054.1 porin family protein [Bdellovibrio svalbardensis]
MRSLKLSLAAMMTLASLQTAHAQPKESAPQEPPYTQDENEFDTPAESGTTDEMLSIEDEIKSAEPNPTAPVQVAEPKKEESTVNLNEKVPEAGGKNLTAEEEPSVIPVSPVVEVKPAKKIQYGEVVRQSPKGGVEYIHHPQAAKGLLVIEKDGTYVYKTKDSGAYNKTGTFRIGTMDAPTIVSKDGTTNFVTMYHGSPVPIFMFDFEWQPFTSFGRLGVQAGVGFLIEQGRGRFACDNCGTLNGTESKEKYTFIAVPLNLGGIYRLEWTSHQWLAPYISGGGTYIPVAEVRDDNTAPKAVGTPGVYGAGGMMFNVSAFDRNTAFTLRNEYGISNLWLTAEYRYLKTFNEDLDFTSNIITLGIGVDY